MDIDERIKLIKRNTVEVVTEEELKHILETKTQPITYTGYEPSGPLHMGHAVTIMKLKDLEKAGCKVKILLADVHALLNKKGTIDEIEEQCRIWEKSMKAMGLKNPEIVLGSEFQYDKDYINDLHSIALKITLNRALRSMQEIARDVKNAVVSQMLYPLMQALDIKFLSVDIAQGGMEQRKIHMLARDIFNSEFGLPGPTCVHTPLISSLTGPGSKMSSSIPDSLISVLDNEEQIKKKLKKAYCPAKIVEDNPVLQIAQLIVFPSIDELSFTRPEKFGGDITFSTYDELEKVFINGNLHPLDLKNSVAREVASIFAPVKSVFEKEK